MVRYLYLKYSLLYSLAGLAAGHIPIPDPTVPDAFSVRLTGGTIPLEGRVEVYYDNKWNTVCGTDWDITEALTICRQLGLGSAVEGGIWSSLLETTPTPPSNVETSTDEEFGILSVTCDDSTESITNCTVSKITDNQCNHSADAGVVCSETSKSGKFMGFIFRLFVCLMVCSVVDVSGNVGKNTTLIRPFYKARAPVRLRLPVTQESTKSLKTLFKDI